MSRSRKPFYLMVCGASLEAAAAIALAILGAWPFAIFKLACAAFVAVMAHDLWSDLREAGR